MTKKVRLGHTDLEINPIGLGANKIAEANPETHTEYGGDIILAAVEAGMDFIDTAFVYGNGTSETIIGETVKKHHLRDQLVIATKGAHEFTPEGRRYNNRPEFLTQQVEDSLRRLQTDYIDLYYIHFPDEDTPKAEAIGALTRLKEQGKIRSIGVSNFSLEQIREGNADGGIEVIQDEYNLLNRTAETELFPYLKENGIGFIPYFPLASGLLAGTYHLDSKLSENQKNKAHFQGETYRDIIQRVDQIRSLAGKHGTGLQNIVLAYYLLQEQVDALIPGARNRKQMLENLETNHIRLDEEDIRMIETAFPKDFHI